MDNYRRYHHFRSRQSAANAARLRRFLAVVIGIVVLVFLWKGLRGSPKPSSEANMNISPLLTATINGNTNAPATAVASTSPLTTAKCPGVISQYGEAKKIALTFNAAGTGIGAAEKIRDELKAANAGGAFFLTGAWIEKNPDVTKSLADTGYGVYNYTYDKPHPANLSAEELADQLVKAEQVIQEKSGKSPRPFFRPPYGEFNDTIVKTAKEGGYCVIHWTVDAMDWQEGQTLEGAKARVLDKARPGAIVLMNVGSDLVAELVPALIGDLRGKGYELISLESLLSS